MFTNAISDYINREDVASLISGEPDTDYCNTYEKAVSLGLKPYDEWTGIDIYRRILHFYKTGLLMLQFDVRLLLFVPEHNLKQLLTPHTQVCIAETGSVIEFYEVEFTLVNALHSVDIANMLEAR